MAAALKPVPHDNARRACCGQPLREFVPVSDAAATLAEALVEALDLPEHETGLHSLRACLP